MQTATLCSSAPATLTETQRRSLEAASTQAWMEYRGAVTNKGEPMEWIDRLWLHAILVDQSPELVVRKGAQIGMSTVEIFKVLHECYFKNIIAIYILPTDTFVKEFVTAKVDPIMKFNSIPTSGKDSISEKFLGSGETQSFLFFKGSWTERAAIMLDADYLVFDEMDFCDPDVLQTYLSRVKASGQAWMHRFSTPTYPNKRIDGAYQKTDMRHWFVKCSHCGYDWYLDWPLVHDGKGIAGNVDFDRKCYVCAKCQGVITDDDRRSGHWVRKWREGDRTHGYWVSQVMAPWISCADLIAEEQVVSKDYFLNFSIGKPYAGSDVNVSRGLITAALRSSRPDVRELCMGVDVHGHEHFFVIGDERGPREWGSIPFTDSDEDKGYNRIHAKMTEHDIKTCVIDGNPHTEESRAFAEAHPNKVFLCYFRPLEQSPSPQVFDEDKYIVNAERQRVITRTVSEFQKGQVGLYIDPFDMEFDRYVAHWGNLYLKRETGRDGQEREIWDNGGDPDHYALATVYQRMALHRFGFNEPELVAVPEKDEPEPGMPIMAEEEEDYEWYND